MYKTHKHQSYDFVVMELCNFLTCAEQRNLAQMQLQPLIHDLC